VGSGAHTPRPNKRMEKNSKEQMVLVLFEEIDGRHDTVVGCIVAQDSSFIKVKTRSNIVSIPICRIIKIKEKLEDG
jgi:hypothetical protein